MIENYHLTHLQTRHWENHNGYLQIIHFIHSHEKNISRENDETIMFKLSAQYSSRSFSFSNYVCITIKIYQSEKPILVNLNVYKLIYIYVKVLSYSRK